VFLLEIEVPTMLARLDAPSRDNDFGRTGDTREQLRRWLPGYQARMRAFGAIPIDARQPLDHVVDAMLAQTRAAGATRLAADEARVPWSPGSAALG
jgi:thymidylate kinase